MTKRIIALLLALILTVGLLPTVALAAEGDPTTDGDSTGTISGGTVQVVGNPKQSVEHSNSDDPIHIKKSVSKGTDGKDYLTMEAYVTNPLEIKQEAVPIDIVLVLDVSGSMDDPLRKENVPRFERYWNDTTNSDYLYYAQTKWGVYSAEDKDTQVSVTAKDTYESVSRLTYGELERSGRNVSYYAKDSTGKYHSLKIGTYWFKNYLYIDNQRNHEVPSNWNSQIHLSGYEIYKVDSNKTTYTYTDKTGNVILTSTGPNSRPTNDNGQLVPFYYYNGETQKNVDKIDALKEAANNFIAKVAEQELPADADGNAQYNRISIVKFAGNKTDKEGNDTYRKSGYTHNYSQIVKPLTNVDASGVTGLKKAVNALEPAGETRADYGMEKAQEALKDHGTRPSVVIMFTDGTPTKTDTFDAEVASNAVNAAKALKDAGTFVYTIAVYDGANPSEDPTKPGAENFNKYLHAVSSNYPTATASKTGRNNFNVTFGNRVSSEKNYYFKADNAIGLNNVFETISREVSNLALVVDSTAVLSDTLSGYFTFDGVDSSNKTGITVNRVPANGHVDESGKVTWDTNASTDITSRVTINIEGKSVTVTGFDYASDKESERNIVTVHADGSVTGAKLVITFPIKPDDSVTWTEGTANYPTNSTTSPDEACLRNYALKSDKDNKNQKTQLTESPEIQYEAHKVTYVIDSTGYTGTVTAPAEKVYREGVQYTIEATPTLDSGYKFTGWKDNDKYTGADVTGTKPMGDTSVTYYGKIEKNEVTVDLSKFVQKKLKLTGVTELPAAEVFTVTLTEGSTTYTATTDPIKSTPDADNLPTFKNGLGAVTLSVGTHTFNVQETVPNDENKTPGMNYSSATPTLTVTVKADGTTECTTPVTIENSYSTTSTYLTLRGDFWKQLESNTTEIPDGAKSFAMTIKDKDGVLVATGTVTDMALSSGKLNNKYVNSDYFSFTNASGQTITALPFASAGTFTYFVQETVPAMPVAGMAYDDTVYTLTVKVENNGGKLEIESAQVTKLGEGDNPVVVADLKQGEDFTITNTFTAAELPLDPPTDPTQGTAKIVKALSSDSDTPTVDLPFKASLTGGIGFARRVARATVKAGEKTADFSGFGTLVFTGVDVYEYVISEDSDNPISGVIYDQTRYTLKVDVRENDNHELYIHSARYTAGQVEGNILTTPITFTNKYTKPENATVVSKTVVTDLLTLSIPMRNAIHEFESSIGTTILYPVANNGTNTLEVTKDTKTARLLYKISVDAGTQQFLQFDDANVDNSYWYDSDKVAVSKVGDKFTVQFKNNVRTADIYVTVNHTLNFNEKGECTVENAIGEIKATTTVTKKDPSKLTINFADYVKKELTATGSKTASDVDFTVDVKGKEWITIIISAKGEEAISTYADEFDPKYSRTLTAHFDSITGGETKTAPFNGSTVEIDHAGQYFFVLTEEKGTRTGVTYDESVYTVYISVEEKEGKLEVANVTIYKDYKLFDGQIITFHNTIDTGRDDYIPIIIPTIINKDTGMLNKTDHFAYVIGYPDGTVHPNGQITRAEVATIFFRLLRDEVRDGAFTTSNSYSDVAYGKWYNNPISTMSALGIITGYPDGTFKPNKPITRAEFAAIAARFDETQSGKSATFSDVIGHWAAKEIGIAYYNDWIKGYPDGTFKPDQNITRAEAMTLINRVLERKPESPADLLTNMNKWTDNMDTSKWYYLDVQEATNSHGYTRKTFNYELWRQMLPDPDWSRYER